MSEATVSAFVAKTSQRSTLTFMFTSKLNLAYTVLYEISNVGPEVVVVQSLAEVALKKKARVRNLFICL